MRVSNLIDDLLSSAGGAEAPLVFLEVVFGAVRIRKVGVGMGD